MALKENSPMFMVTLFEIFCRNGFDLVGNPGSRVYKSGYIGGMRALCSTNS